MLCLKCRKPLGVEPGNYGLHQKCFNQWFSVSSAAEFQNLMRRDATSDTDKKNHDQSVNNSFFHGKFKKYSAILGDASYILKMRQKEAPELPEVEYLCNQIGSLLAIPVAEYFVIHFSGETVFVTKNFINNKNISDLQHIYHFRQDSDHSCEGLIQTIKRQTGKPYDVKVLINTILFDSLIGNHDRHGRNLAFIIKANSIVLSPIYDNVSYLSLEQGEILKADFNPTGKISTSKTLEPSMKDYVEELQSLGFKNEIVNFSVRIKMSKINFLIKNSLCSNNMKFALKRLITKRYEELKNAL